MVAYKTLVHTYIALAHWTIQSNRQMLSSYSPRLRCSASAIRCSSCFSPILSPNPRLAISSRRASLRYYSLGEGALAMENAECNDLSTSNGFSLGDQEDLAKDTVERLLLSRDDVGRLMMMERQTVANPGAKQATRWFPYVDIFKAGNHSLSSSEVLEALDPYISEVRKDRFRNVVKNRSYSLCLVVEGLTDFGNVSAAFRSADALGIQSVHVVSHDSSKRYRDNRHVSMGAEKWLDIEIWNSTEECFKTLKSRGYRVATTHVGLDAVSVYDMNWTQPTAIVVGNENRGISSVALQFSDLHCSIPMKGMVDSFNVSVAAGILMHHAVCDRISRTGRHGDLTLEESQILLAEFSLRHNKNTISIAHEYATRRTERAMPKL